MKIAPLRPDAISEDDWGAVGVPEATGAEFAHAVPFATAHSHLGRLGDANASQAASPAAARRVPLRLPADLVVEAIRATGRGYTRRVEEVLKRALAAGEL